MLYIQSFIRSHLCYRSVCGGCRTYAETFI